MKELRLKGSEKLLKMISSFSATEKVIFGILSIVALFSALNLAWKVNALFLVPIPSYGGSFTEGEIGLPRSINPVLAFTNTDKDLSMLIYSGLMKYDGDKLVPDLADSYTVSDDGLVYTFKLKENLQFHDGALLTTDDVEFTIQKVQDSDIKSPKRADWASITINKVSPTEIQFILKQPYAPFLGNTTIGILPKNLWKNLDADQFIFNQKNLEPIGAGPYQIESIKKDDAGIPFSYTLSSFKKFHSGRPYISNININFYQNEDEVITAFKNGDIQNFAGISPQKASEIASTSESVTILHNPLPRIFGLFLNQNNSPVLAYKEIRQALNMSVDRDRIVNEVLYNYGVSMNGPLIKYNTVGKPDIEGAKALLAKAGWVPNAGGILEKKVGTTMRTFEFSIVTADSPDLKMVAEQIKKDWRKIGADVVVKVFEYGDLSQNIIKTRKYDSLLFGQIMNKDLDLYAFWHSSQRNSPGLNVSMYVNSKVDGYLEDVRVETDEKRREDIYQSFQKTLTEDIPAIFLYSPEYIYVMSKKIGGYKEDSITNHSDRFYGIEKWFITTDKVWKVFVK